MAILCDLQFPSILFLLFLYLSILHASFLYLYKLNHVDLMLYSNIVSVRVSKRIKFNLIFKPFSLAHFTTHDYLYSQDMACKLPSSCDRGMSLYIHSVYKLTARKTVRKLHTNVFFLLR